MQRIRPCNSLPLFVLRVETESETESENQPVVIEVNNESALVNHVRLTRNVETPPATTKEEPSRSCATEPEARRSDLFPSPGDQLIPPHFCAQSGSSAT